MALCSAARARPSVSASGSRPVLRTAPRFQAQGEPHALARRASVAWPMLRQGEFVDPGREAARAAKSSRRLRTLMSASSAASFAMSSSSFPRRCGNVGRRRAISNLAARRRNACRRAIATSRVPRHARNAATPESVTKNSEMVTIEHEASDVARRREFLRYTWPFSINAW